MKHEQTGEGSEGAIRKTAKERLRQDAEQKEIDRSGDEQRDQITGHAKCRHEPPGQQEQSRDVGKIGHEQNGREQAFRFLEQAVERDGGAIAQLHLVAQAHLIEREQPRLDAGENERHHPAEKNDGPANHASESTPAEGSSSAPARGFSSRSSSMRLRLTRRTVMASRGISRVAPTSGKYPSRLKT